MLSATCQVLSRWKQLISQGTVEGKIQMRQHVACCQRKSQCIHTASRHSSQAVRLQIAFMRLEMISLEVPAVQQAGLNHKAPTSSKEKD